MEENEMKRILNTGGMKLQYFLDNYKKDFEENHGVYVVSVENLEGYRGFYKVGMSDVGSVSTRLGNFKTFFWLVLDKVKIHAIATKRRGRILLNEKRNNPTRNAETSMHNTMKHDNWENFGEWYKPPELFSLMDMLVDKHYGTEGTQGDGESGRVYLFEPTKYNKIERVILNPVPVQPIRRNSTVRKTTKNINGVTRKQFKVRVEDSYGHPIRYITSPP